MKILFFRGGMGNQLFQYAYYRYLLKKGFGPIKLDAFSPSMRKKYGFQLREIFPEIAGDRNFLPYILARPSYLLFDGLNKLFKINLFTDTGSIDRPEIPAGKVWIRGLWQEYRFMNPMRDELLQTFRFIDFGPDEKENIALLPQITGTNSVSIHIRRGNYLKPSQRPYFGDLCPLEYYRDAVEKIKELVPDPAFFVFSNDPTWVKQHLDLPHAVFIDWNTGDRSYRDMHLMSLCKHNIVANSTFSWWAAWLNQNAGKIVVTPGKWINDARPGFYDKLIPAEWIRVGDVKPFVTLIADRPLAPEEIRDILKQGYADFELLLSESTEIEDKRISLAPAEPKGIHRFFLDEETIGQFKDRKFLRKWLIRSFAENKDF